MRLDIQGLRKRVQRLMALSLGLARERFVWEEANDPLLYLERKAYLQAVRDAIAGVESARVVLVKVCHRIDREGSRVEAG